MLKKKFKLYDNREKEYMDDGYWFTIWEAVNRLMDFADSRIDKKFPTFMDFAQSIEGTPEEKLAQLCEMNDIDTHYYIYVTDEEFGQVVWWEYDDASIVESYLADNPGIIAECQFYI